MKVGQKSIVRWIAKRFVKQDVASASKVNTGFQTLNVEQLRHVGGGTSTQLPKVGGW